MNRILKYILFSVLLVANQINASVQSTSVQDNNLFDLEIEKTKVHAEIDNLVAQAIKDYKGEHEDIQITIENAPELHTLISIVAKEAKLEMPKTIKIKASLIDAGLTYYNDCGTLLIPSFISQILTENEIKALVEATLKTGKAFSSLSFRLKSKIINGLAIILAFPAAPLAGAFMNAALGVPPRGSAAVTSIPGKILDYIITIPVFAYLVLIAGPCLLLVFCLLELEKSCKKQNVKNGDRGVKDITSLISSIKKVCAYNIFENRQKYGASGIGTSGKERSEEKYSEIVQGLEDIKDGHLYFSGQYMLINERLEPLKKALK